MSAMRTSGGARDERDRHVVLVDGSVEVVEVVGPLRAADHDRWPCPRCGRYRPVRTALVVRVRNRIGPAHERPVALCASCRSEMLPDLDATTPGDPVQRDTTSR